MGRKLRNYSTSTASGISALTLIATLGCSQSDTLEDPYGPDENIRYEYTGSECHESGIEEITNIGNGLNLELEILERSSTGYGSMNVNCRFHDVEEGIRITGDDADFTGLQLDFTLIDQLDHLDIYNDPITDSFNPVTFVHEEYSDDEWDFIMLRSWSSIDGDYRFVDLHAQHEHLIVSTHMMVSPDAPEFNIGINTLDEDDFDEATWKSMQEFDDEFQQELIDFNFEVADNLKQALVKDNE